VRGTRPTDEKPVGAPDLHIVRHNSIVAGAGAKASRRGGPTYPSAVRSGERDVTQLGQSKQRRTPPGCELKGR
jgi:hypothetical protein